jgi:hypothetical protein
MFAPDPLAFRTRGLRPARGAWHRGHRPGPASVEHQGGQSNTHLSRKERMSISNYNLRRAAPSELMIRSQWTTVRFKSAIS